MPWLVQLHPDVHEDLRSLGKSQARIIIDVMESRLANGEPDKSGKALTGKLAGYRRLRTGRLRIVYKINTELIEVFVIAAGSRRNDEVNEAALSRLK